ncbi:hypothetical protein AT2G12205, partial [Arabidopsis thaliana]
KLRSVAGQKFGFSAATFSSSATVELKFKPPVSSNLVAATSEL